MADGSPLRYGKYRVKIWGTYGLGAPGKTWTFNLKESNNGKAFVLYVNWHLVKLQTKLGSPAQTWSTSIQGPRYVLSEEAAYYAHDVQRPIYVEAHISASGSLTSQTLTDLVLKDVLCTVPYKADPRSYYRAKQRGTACSVAASRPMYSVSEDFEEYEFYSYTESVFATFAHYYINKYKTHITPEDVNTCYKLTTLKNLSDYAKIPNACPYTGHRGSMASNQHIPTKISPSFSSWHIADLSYGDGYHSLQLYQNKNQLDKKTNSWPLISQIQIDITQEEHARQTVYYDYGETFWAVNGYCYPESYAKVNTNIPVGANFSSVISGINYYNSDNHSYYYKYESDNIVRFSSNKPTGDGISNIQPFEVYNRSSFSFGSKQGHYTKSQLQKALPNVYNYKPWREEVPYDKFKIEMDESQGVTNYGVSSPTFFYLYDEQSWSSCCCYALFKAVPTIDSVPSLSNF